MCLRRGMGRRRVRGDGAKFEMFRLGLGLGLELLKVWPLARLDVFIVLFYLFGSLLLPRLVVFSSVSA